MIDFSAAGEQFQAYRADPTGPPRGAVLVVHEIWGLHAHIRDVADRFAAAGYLAVAPDLMGLAGLDATLMAELGARLADPAEKSDIQPKIRAALQPMNAPERAARIRAGVAAAFEHLQSSAEGAGRTAVVGYCFGGTYAFALAVEEPRLAAAVPFYGHASYSVAELASIACPVLAFYGADDVALMDALPELVTHMKKAGVDFRHTVFDGAGHAFFNDSNPIMHRPEAAQTAWMATLEFLAQQLA